MRADANARQSSPARSTTFDWCAGPGKGPAAASLREIAREKTDVAKYLPFACVEDAGRWLIENGYGYECTTHIGYPVATLTNFWGPPVDRFGGRTALVASYDDETKELAVWNTNAMAIDPHDRHEKMVDELISSLGMVE